MDEKTFDRCLCLFGAAQIVWERLGAAAPCSPEWHRLRRKHDLLAARYRIAAAAAQGVTIH